MALPRTIEVGKPVFTHSFYTESRAGSVHVRIMATSTTNGILNRPGSMYES